MLPLPFIDRFGIDELQGISKYIRWGIWGFGAVAVILTWASHKVTDRIQAMQLVEKANSKDRAFSVKQQQDAKAAMEQRFPNGLPIPLIIASKMLDRESEQYARQIAGSFAPFPDTNFSVMGIFPFQGVRVFPVGEAAAGPARLVREAFEVAGLPFTTEPFNPASCPIHPSPGIFVFVGHK